MKRNNKRYLIYLSLFILMIHTGCEDLTLEETTFIDLDAQFTADAFVAQVGQEIQFTQQSTIVAQRFNWDFGDGDTSLVANPTHAYDTTGIFTVTFIALKEDGITTDSTSREIIIIPKTENFESKEKTFGEDNASEIGRSLQALNGGGFILASRKNISTIQLLKLKDDLTPEDTIDISGLAVGQGQVFVSDVVSAIDGGFVVVGYYNYSPDGGDNDSFVVKVNSNLEEEWRQVISTPLNERAVAVNQLSGSFFVTSSVSDASTSYIQSDVYDNTGGFTDNNNVGTSWSGEHIIQTRDGGSIIAANDADNPMLLRVDSDFEQLWREVSSFDGRSWGVTETQDRGIVMVGSVAPSSEKPDSTQAFISKYNDSGSELLWSHTLGLYNDIFYDVVELSDESIVTLGINKNPLTGEDILLCKYPKFVGDGENTNNQPTKVKLIGGLQDDGAYKLVTKDDKIYIIGYTKSLGNTIGRSDVYFLELDANLE